MTEPLVCAILLTRDRPEMAARAVRCFREQTYLRKELLVWDSGDPTWQPVPGGKRQEHYCTTPSAAKSIGRLRNEALAFACSGIPAVPDIFVTFDSDDISHPNRIAEQLSLLQSGDYDAVGYNQVLFWKTPCGPSDVDPIERTMPVIPGEAWLYTHGRNSNYALGTSLSYWRHAWQTKPFADLPQPGNRQSVSEDFVWQSGLRVKSVSSIGEDGEPRMVCSIHGANYGQSNYERAMRAGQEFRRVPEWDARVRAWIVRCFL